MSAAAILANAMPPAAASSGEAKGTARAAKSTAFADLVSNQPNDDKPATKSAVAHNTPRTAAKASQPAATSEAPPASAPPETPAATAGVDPSSEDEGLRDGEAAPTAQTAAETEDASNTPDNALAIIPSLVPSPIAVAASEAGAFGGRIARQIDDPRQTPEMDLASADPAAAAAAADVDLEQAVAKTLAAAQTTRTPASDKLAALAAAVLAPSTASRAASDQRLDAASNTESGDSSDSTSFETSQASSNRMASTTPSVQSQAPAAPAAGTAPGQLAANQAGSLPAIADAAAEPALLAAPGGTPQNASSTTPTATFVPASFSTLAQATLDTTVHLAAQITRRLEGRSTRFELGLTPEGLGRVDVSLDIDADGRLTARLAFDNPLAATELRGKADELRRELQDAGFTIAQDGLEFSERQASSGQGFDRRQGKAFAGASRINAEADLAQPAPAAWVSLSMTPRGVDMKV